MANVVILARKSQWGLAHEAKLIEQVFREANALKTIRIDTIDHMDPYTFTNPQPVDIQVHLEVPCRQAWPWAKINIVVVNPEGWMKSAWDWALVAADLVVFKSPHVAALFPEVPADRRVVIPWRPRPLDSPQTEKENHVLYLLGGSKNKAAAAKTIVSVWKSDWPTLEVCGASELIQPLQKLGEGKNILWSTAYRTAEEMRSVQQSARFHCVASVAEGFGFSMAETAQYGSLPLWVGLPVQDYTWGSVLGSVGRIHPSGSQPSSDVREGPVQFTETDVCNAMQSLLDLRPDQEKRLRSAFQARAASLSSEFRQGWKRVFTSLKSKLPKIVQPYIPKRIPATDLPHVAVITLTHNRPRWFTNMSRNILLSDYPTEKLSWIIVDDSDGFGRVDDQVMRFREKAPSIHVEYLSLSKKLTVGEKRNRGCKAAPEKTEVFLMMDDDDHYPKSSIEARVSYLRGLSGVECVYCSTLPMYDCRRYISAMNVPPLNLAPAERVSEASLAFTRKFWEERAFPTISVAEGEEFIHGREKQTAEIAPDGVIVSFLHNKNATSRRVPESQEPNGCHYGFSDEFFQYLCEMSQS